MTETPETPRRSEGFRRAEQGSERTGEQPIEVHEHIEVEGATSSRAAVPTPAPAPVVATAPATAPPTVPRDDRVELSGFSAQRDRMWHDHVTTRRARRFGLAGLFAFGLTIVLAASIFNGGLRGESLAAPLGSDEVLLVGLLTVVVGLIVSWGAGQGHVAALAVAWLAGLLAMVAGVQQYLQGFDVSATGQILVGLVGVLGLGLLVTSTLGLSSVRGRQVQNSILGAQPPTGRFG